METKKFLGRRPHHLLLVLVFAVLHSAVPPAAAQLDAGDAAAMQALLKSLTNAEKALGWSESSDPCQWEGVRCNGNRVSAIQVGKRGLLGGLAPEIRNLTGLIHLDFKTNSLTGPIPSLAGLSALQVLHLGQNQFSSIPQDFFSGLFSLSNVYLDSIPLAGWTIPPSLRDDSGLVNFSANDVNLTGTIPDFLGTDFPNFYHLALAFNNLEGPLPSSFAVSPLSSLWLNNQKESGLTGRIDVIHNMTNLKQLQLQSNSFSGPIPDISGLQYLFYLGFRDNQLTGPVPTSLTSLESLQTVILTNNLLQGPVPVFPASVMNVDLIPSSERFCLEEEGVDCDPRVNVLLSIAKSFGYPVILANGWKGNDPCQGFTGITCDRSGNITAVSLGNMGFSGTISPDFHLLLELQKLVLSGNNLTGTIPSELTNLKNLHFVDVSHNALWGKVPNFDENVTVYTEGNPGIGSQRSPGNVSQRSPGNVSQSLPAPETPKSSNGSKAVPVDGFAVNWTSRWFRGVIIGVAEACGVLVIAILVFRHFKRKAQTTKYQVAHLRHPGSNRKLSKDTAVGKAFSSNSLLSHGSDAAEHGSMVFSIQLLREVTNNFSLDNILGRGGFGTVYKGVLHDGSTIAVKRMENGEMGSKGLHEFMSEISVLTKLRHRHLVSLLGYCLEGNERILVYEHMPQGTLSHHLFDWINNGLKPLAWKKRLNVALDVARGVDYLHNLANQSFIHRDLKPSNILLGDNMRAKVADFGLVRLAPEGNHSIETRLAGTFGYLAPEYAVLGRVTTKSDVYSFGVILMELITGRKAIDNTQPEGTMHLVSWFWRIHYNKDTFKEAIDPNITLDEETIDSISTVSSLACHCTARDPHLRPEMGYVVSILSSLIDIWKPTDADLKRDYGIDLDTPLPDIIKKWKELANDSQFDGNSSLSYSSIPAKPTSFAESFTSTDAR